MRERPSPRTPLSFLLARDTALRAAAFLATLGLASAGIALGATNAPSATPFQVAYMYGTSGPAGGGTAINLVGNQFSPGATATIGGVGVGAIVTSSTRMGVTSPALAPGALYDVIVNNGANSGVLPKGWLADFGDVAAASPFHAPVETIIRDGITSGCGGGNYCPSSSVTRAQMAVFLLRAEHGSGYVPPAATGTIFGDVHQGDFAADWIEQLYAEGITGGCQAGSPPNYCPASSVTRGQMAAFLLKIYHGNGYAPPTATGVFSDVPTGLPLAPWIEELARLAVTSGCGGSQYCPSNPVTRGQMAVFLAKTFHRPEADALPRAGDLGPEGLRDQRRARRRVPLLDGLAVLAAGLDLPAPEPRARLDAPGLRRRHRRHAPELPARQLLDVAPVHDVLHERPVPARPAAPARLLRAPQDGRDLDEQRQPPEPSTSRTSTSWSTTRSATTGTSSTTSRSIPAMGAFLNMNTSTKNNPNENYPREIMQLFSIGTDLLNQDGTTQNDSISGLPLPSYDQSVIDNLKLVFTGWKIPSVTVPPLAGESGDTSGDYLNPMLLQSSNHNTANEKDLFVGFLPNLNGEGTPTVIPSGQTGDVELPQAIDALFNHPNVGPYLARELIHSLVTSNPSPAYIERVAGFYNDNGSGVRGSLWAMVKGVLLDPEARNVSTDITYGKLKEPALYELGILRAFNAMSANRSVNSDGYLSTCCNCTRDQGQEVFRPPTVFSYFPQDYNAPPASAGLLGPGVRHHGRLDVPEARELHEHHDLLEHRGQLQRDVVLHAGRHLDRPDGAPAARADAGQPGGQAQPAAACTAPCPTKCGPPSKPRSMPSRRRPTR